MMPKSDNALLLALKEALPFKIENKSHERERISSDRDIVLVKTKDFQHLRSVIDQGNYQLSQYPNLSNAIGNILEAGTLEEYMQIVGSLRDVYLEDMKSLPPVSEMDDDAAEDPLLKEIEQLQVTIYSNIAPRLITEALSQAKWDLSSAKQHNDVLMEEVEDSLNQLDQLVVQHEQLQLENKHLTAQLKAANAALSPAYVPEASSKKADIIHELEAKIEELNRSLTLNTSAYDQIASTITSQKLQIVKLKSAVAEYDLNLSTIEGTEERLRAKIAELTQAKEDSQAALSTALEKNEYLERLTHELKENLTEKRDRKASSAAPSLADELVPDQVQQLTERLAQAHKKIEKLQNPNEADLQDKAQQALYTTILALEQQKVILKNRLPLFARFRAGLRSFMRRLIGWPAKASYERDLDDINQIEENLKKGDWGISASFDESFNLAAHSTLEAHLAMFQPPSLPPQPHGLKEEERPGDKPARKGEKIVQAQKKPRMR